MTYRERRERKAEKLREWAEKRQRDAAATFKAHEVYHGDHAFNTQPGHIPERARVIAREERAFKSLDKAEGMASRAAGIEDQLDRSIYDDDPDAVERLEERVAELEAKRTRMKAINAAYRKRDAAKLAELGSLTLEMWDAEMETRYSFQRQPHPSYELQNLGGNIKRNRDRLASLRQRLERAARAESAGGVVVETRGSVSPGREYVSVTFAEKPDREVLDALKAAGFRWGQGSWVGLRSDLPELAVFEDK